MSELQSYYESFNSGYWADPDADRCRCHGSGYALSEVDTWHQCPYHWSKDKPHPEDDYHADYYGEAHAAVHEEHSPCPECGDGQDFPPTECPRCKDGILRELHRDDEVTRFEDDESHLPHSEGDTYTREGDIPF